MASSKIMNLSKINGEKINGVEMDQRTIIGVESSLSNSSLGINRTRDNGEAFNPISFKEISNNGVEISHKPSSGAAKCRATNNGAVRCRVASRAGASKAAVSPRQAPHSPLSGRPR